MKMTKKKAALVSAFAVAIVAMAGVGYAINYQGTASSTNDTVNNSYVVVSLDNYGSQTISGIYYNTVTTSTKTTYELAGAQEFPVNTITIDETNTGHSEWTVKVVFNSAPAIPGATIKWDLGTATNKTTTELETGVALGEGDHVLKLKLTSDGTSNNENIGTSVTLPAYTVTVLHTDA